MWWFNRVVPEGKDCEFALDGGVGAKVLGALDMPAGKVEPATGRGRVGRLADELLAERAEALDDSNTALTAGTRAAASVMHTRLAGVTFHAGNYK